MGLLKWVGAFGRGPVAKSPAMTLQALAAVRVRARPVRTSGLKNWQGFSLGHTSALTGTYAAKVRATWNLPVWHESAGLSLGDHVRGQDHPNGLKSNWAVLQWVRRRDLPQDRPKTFGSLRAGDCSSSPTTASWIGSVRWRMWLATRCCAMAMRHLMPVQLAIRIHPYGYALAP